MAQLIDGLLALSRVTCGVFQRLHAADFEGTGVISSFTFRALNRAFWEIAMPLRHWTLSGVLLFGLSSAPAAQPAAAPAAQPGASAAGSSSSQGDGGVPPKEIRVTLLGTASGPRVHPRLAGISTLVEAGGQRLLFDAGRGVMQRVVQAGFAMSAVTKLFLTHLHSDHVIGVPDLLLSPWPAAPERKVPLEVWGPHGTRAMMHHLEQAFAFDIHMRRDVDESFSPEGIRVIARDIREGKVYESNGVTVTAFAVTHGRVAPSYGYRVDYAGRSVALSGDTSPSDRLVAACRGVDVLIHEAIDPQVLKGLVPDGPHLQAIVARHTTPEQAAVIFGRVSPRLAVFSHSPGTPAIVEQVRQSYPGRVEMGQDLMVIDIGGEVRVRPARTSQTIPSAISDRRAPPIRATPATFRTRGFGIELVEKQHASRRRGATSTARPGVSQMRQPGAAR